jgi:thymidylate synthase (FAD)
MEAVYVDHMGDDLRVVNAARVSFNKQSDWVPADGFDFMMLGSDLKEGDKKLISYLARHGHWTPFSHPMVTMREKVPIFVARQRFKHTVGFTYNEVSRRYVDDTPELFVPDEWRARPEGSVKQGSGDTVVDSFSKYPNTWGCKNLYEELMDEIMDAYRYMLDKGVAPEQARMILPQSMYTEYYVTGSLAAWARAYKQRIDPHAQKEIQDLAVTWGNVMKKLFPISWEALTV